MDLTNRTARFALALVTVTAWSMPIAAGQQRTSPVMVGGNDGLDACMSYGEVVGLDPAGDGFLSVRAGPGTHHGEVDRLSLGTGAFACDEATADDGTSWVGIVYGEECGVSSPIDGRHPYDGPCRSGWVHADYFVITAG
ncbi:hypothetical protein GCM10007989_15590 [Devosia pacifica]|uniref:Integron n=1 Tax=Devosia pacifica TaxID=1335967 RepID=A0A918VTA4_9HYPH|nr:integron [Devosia pacifica]GHA21240.1 hypothetical protein GCM10007989_15590 [Devosia pacifica]